jgi:3-oxoacyl-[acyl-carrier protein] reductase
MEIRLHGKIALVTGGGSGIGRAIASELGQSGAYVIVHYRNSETGAKETLDCIKQAGGSGEIAKADLTGAAQVEQLMSDIKAKSGHLDILVNNAGTLVKRSKIAEMSEALFDEVMDVNFKTTFLCCRAAVPLMTGRGWGRIVNMSSVAAHDGGGNGATIYAASKAAIATFTNGFAKELAPQGITVNCVAPGLIGETPFHDTYSTKESRQNMVNNTPLAREGVPQDVAGAVIFLASDQAAFITGETVNINGGIRMC